MSDKETTNYRLRLLDLADGIARQELNANFTQTDSLLKTLDNAINGVDSRKPELALGSYTGDGTASRTVQLGFTPKALILASAEGRMSTGNTGSDICGGVFFPGGTHPTCGVVTGGFRVSSTSDTGLSTNQEKGKYFYMAVR